MMIITTTTAPIAPPIMGHGGPSKQCFKNNSDKLVIIVTNPSDLTVSEKLHRVQTHPNCDLFSKRVKSFEVKAIDEYFAIKLLNSTR